MRASAKSYQKFLAMGYLGKDPYYKKFEKTGQAVARFDVAITRSWKDKSTGEWQEATFWCRCEAWRYLADRAAKFRKGDKIWIEGIFETQEWKQDDGTERQAMVLKVADCFLVATKHGRTEYAETDSGEKDDEMPF